MRSSLNLRGDLARLDDAELAARLDATLRKIEALEARRRAALLGGFVISRSRGWRGPLRARAVYRAVPWLAVLVQLCLGSGVEAGGRDERALSLAHCEAKDLMDEIRRRLEARRSTEATGRP